MTPHPTPDPTPDSTSPSSPSAALCPKCEAGSYILVHCERGVGVWYCTSCLHVANVPVKSPDTSTSSPTPDTPQVTPEDTLPAAKPTLSCPLCGEALAEANGIRGMGLRCSSCKLTFSAQFRDSNLKSVTVHQEDGCLCRRVWDRETKEIRCTSCRPFENNSSNMQEPRLIQMAMQYAHAVEQERDSRAKPLSCCCVLFRDSVIFVRTLWMAAQHNNVAVMKLMCRLRPQFCTWGNLCMVWPLAVEHVLDRCLSLGAVSALQWLHRRYHLKEYLDTPDYRALYAAVDAKQAGVVTWLQRVVGVTGDKNKLFLHTFDLDHLPRQRIMRLHKYLGMTLSTALQLLAKETTAGQRKDIQGWILFHVLPSFGLGPRFLDNMRQLCQSLTYDKLAKPAHHLTPTGIRAIVKDAVSNGVLDALIWYSYIKPSHFLAHHLHMDKLMKAGHEHLLNWFVKRYTLDPRDYARYLVGAPASTVQWYVQRVGQA